jgi:hypothetical protein
MDVDDPIKAKVPVACPSCQHPTSVVVYRHFEEVSMVCAECEHSWSTKAATHPILRTILLFTP